jgi:hypothetical protein
MGRDIIEVIDAMTAVIPASETVILHNFSTIRNSALYMAPEMRAHLWESVSRVLNENIPKPVEDWQLHVAGIFCDKELEYEERVVCEGVLFAQRACIGPVTFFIDDDELETILDAIEGERIKISIKSVKSTRSKYD